MTAFTQPFEVYDVMGQCEEHFIEACTQCALVSNQPYGHFITQRASTKASSRTVWPSHMQYADNQMYPDWTLGSQYQHGSNTGNLLTDQIPARIEGISGTFTDADHLCRVSHMNYMTSVLQDDKTLAASPRSVKNHMPMIVTQFATSSIYAEIPPKGFPNLMEQTDMNPLSAEWSCPDPNFKPIWNDNMDSMMNTPTLQDAFQWHPMMTRRTSVSSRASGPVFSALGTPTSQYDPFMTTPRSQQACWTPQSASSYHSSVQSPKSPSFQRYAHSRRANASLSRTAQSNIPSGQRTQKLREPAKSWPARSKPSMSHGTIDGSTSVVGGNHTNTNGRMLSERRRACSSLPKRGDALRPSKTTQQLGLPPYQLQTIFTTPSPDVQQSEFSANLPIQQSRLPPTTLKSQAHKLDADVETSSVQNLQENAPPPPPSDFTDYSAARQPIRQEPLFDGDVYTPLYKRRDSKNNWEGWCHLCKPGVWLSLKTSRYWDDKKRNHGICCATKKPFPDPQGTRVVDLQGRVVDVDSESIDVRNGNGDRTDDAWIISQVDGSLRKREALCGNCGEWVAMDGPRTKGRDKPVGWWLHCYDCLESSKKASHD